MKNHLALPEIELNEISKHLPGIWSKVEVERLKAERSDLPKWCFLPTETWEEMAFREQYISYQEEDKYFRQGLKGNRINSLVSRISIYGTWRYTKGIYRFDKTFGKALLSTHYDKLPSELLLRLPEWSIYVDVSDLDIVHDIVISTDLTTVTKTAQSFWAMLDYCEGYPVLKLMIHYHDGPIRGFGLPLGDWGLKEAMLHGIEQDYLRFIKRTQDDQAATEVLNHIKQGTLVEPEDKILELLQQMYSPFISMLLYLCSEEPDIKDYKSGERTKRPRTQKTRKGFKLFPAEKVRVWNIGDQVGNSLRACEAEYHRNINHCEHKPHKPHIRRAHWHCFWYGTGEDRKVKCHWLPPIFVNGGADSSTGGLAHKIAA